MLKRVAVITNCSATQSVPAPKELEGKALPRDLTLEEAVEEWYKRLGECEERLTPAQLYRGISFYSVTRMRAIVGEENIFITSIGQGLVGLVEDITPYDLSIDPDHVNSLTRVVTQEVMNAPLWWGAFNARKIGYPSPIMRLVESGDYDLVLVCCTARFLSMIVEDVLMAMTIAPDKVRVIVTSMNMAPNKLKPALLYYDKRINASTVGNRNDMNQRSCLHFLKLLEEDSQAVNESIEDQQARITAALDIIGPTPSVGGVSRTTSAEVLEFLNAHKDIAKMHPDQGYIAAQKAFPKSISQSVFRSAVRMYLKASSPKVRSKPKKVAVEHEAAMNAFAGIADRLDANRGSQVSWEDEQRAVETLETFVEALKEFKPDAAFTSSDVSAWVQQFFGSKEGEEVPVQLKSANKLAHLLKANCDDLGIFEMNPGGGQGGRIYKLVLES